MNISIFGLGYVGAVISACFARNGHSVIGVDTDPTKVQLVNDGRSPIIEQDLEAMLADGVRAGRIRAITQSAEAVLKSDVSMICVGTPSKITGELDLTYVARVCHDIGTALREKKGRHLVVVRSTMLPGSVRGTVIPALEAASGKKAGADFGVAINPEFLRESTAIHDFYNPPKTVIGADRAEDAKQVASLYDGINAPVIATSLEVAEMVKYADNCFHALKITFANEIGAIARTMGVNGREVMDIFCTDQKLNLSPAYLKPGFAYGGSCLPKDLRALTRLAASKDVPVPMLNAISASNEQQIRSAFQMITNQGRRRVGILGFAFKGGTDDLRESPIVSLIELLIGKGYDLKLYDGHVSLARLMGANRRYIEQHIPHLAKLMVESLDEVVTHSELLVIGNQNPQFTEVLTKLRPDQWVLDLRPAERTVNTPARYERVSG